MGQVNDRSIISRGLFWFNAWWFIPLSKWVITPIISGLTLLIPFITGVITHLLSGMSHQVGPWFPVMQHLSLTPSLDLPGWLIISYDIWRLFDVNEDEINTNPETGWLVWLKYINNHKYIHSTPNQIEVAEKNRRSPILKRFIIGRRQKKSEDLKSGGPTDFRLRPGYYPLVN